MGYFMIKDQNLRTKAEKYNLVSKENHHWDLWAETGNKETKRITWLRGDRDKIGSSNLKRTHLKELCLVFREIVPLANFLDKSLGQVFVAWEEMEINPLTPR